MGDRGRPGRVIAERFELQARIGAGGMGEVWRAEHTRLKSPVAVKLLHGSIAGQTDGVPRFLREAQAAAAVRGPNIVQVLDFGIDEDDPYIAMELLEGESLRERLDRESTLPPQEAVSVVSQIAKAMTKAHKQGIVHRDLKPANVFLCTDEDSDELVVKVLDFGIAKVLDGARILDGQLTATGQVLGTMSYVSPEQSRGRMDLDHRSDLWSLAIMTFECLVGALPYKSLRPLDLAVAICREPMPRPSSVAAWLPPAFDAWFERATKRAPDERFQSAGELAEGLRASLAGVEPRS